MNKISVELIDEYKFLMNNNVMYANKTDFACLSILSDMNASPKFGSYYASLINSNDKRLISSISGIIVEMKEYNRSYGLRPVLNIEDIPQEILDKGNKINEHTLIIEYGYFPQSRVSDVYKENDIKDKISNKTINETNKAYSMISMQDKLYCSFCYEENGQLYIKIDTSKIDETIKYPCYYIIKVEPVRWFVDLKTGKVISEKILISNIPYTFDSHENYETSFIKKYLGEILFPELLQFEKAKVNKPLVDKVMNADKEDESVFDFSHNITNENIADKARILTVNEVFKNPCEIIKKVGTEVAVTDFSVATGGIVSNLNHVNDRPSMDNRCGTYLLNSETTNHVSIVNSAGTEIWKNSSGVLNTSQRIVLPFNDINILQAEKSDNDFFEIEFGYYPQMVVSQDLAQTLTNLKNKDALKETGKKYRRYLLIDESRKPNFTDDVCPSVEYEYNGKRYISIVMLNERELSDGVRYAMFKLVWIEVMPVKWYVSKKDNMMISEKVLFSGVPYNYVDKFIKEIFMMDLLQDRNYKIINDLKIEKPLDITFLTLEQVSGNKKLDILEKYGTKATITDFSILLGAFVPQDYYIDGDNSLNGRTCSWWLKSTDENGDAYIVKENGEAFWYNVQATDRGVRPAVCYSSIAEFCTSITKIDSNLMEVEFGEYPQMVVSEEEAIELEKKFYNGDINIKNANKTYTVNLPKFSNCSIQEFKYNGNKYIRFFGIMNYAGKILSNGTSIETGKTYWVKVEPIIWLVDKKANIALSKKILFSGTSFNSNRNYKGDFENTFIKHFIDKFFANEIIPGKTANLNIGETINVQEVTKEEATILGKELLEKISNQNYNDDINQILDLIKKGADVNYKNQFGDFPLLLCACKNYYQTAIVLLKAGANTNETDYHLWPPLMYSIINEYYEMFDLLLDSGCDLNIRDKRGYTALMYAKQEGKKYMFEKLIEKGALLNILNNNNETIFDIESSIDDSSFRPKKKVEYDDTIELVSEAQDRLNSLLDEDSLESIHQKVLKSF